MKAVVALAVFACVAAMVAASDYGHGHHGHHGHGLGHGPRTWTWPSLNKLIYKQNKISLGFYSLREIFCKYIAE